MINNTKKIFIASVVIDSILILIIGFTVYWIMEANKEALIVERDLLYEKGKISNVEVLDTVLSDTKEDREYLKGLFVNKESVVDLLEKIESIGLVTRAIIDVSSITYGEGKEVSDPAVVRFTAEGTWESVLKTVLLIENMPAALSVSSLEMRKFVAITDSTENPLKSGVGKTPASSLWRASFEVEVLKDPASLSI